MSGLILGGVALTLAIAGLVYMLVALVRPEDFE